MTTRLAHTRGKRQQKEGAAVHLLQREESFPARNPRLLFQPGCVSLRGGRGGGKGRRECCFRLWTHVWGSAQAASLISGGEEISLNRYASKSAITSGKFLLISRSHLFPMPMVQFGGLPRITTFFPEFFWLGGVRIRMVPEPHCQDWGGKLLTSARSCIAEPLWLYVNLIRIRSCCYKRKGGGEQTQNKFRSLVKVSESPHIQLPSLTPWIQNTDLSSPQELAGRMCRVSYDTADKCLIW